MAAKISAELVGVLSVVDPFIFVCEDNEGYEAKEWTEFDPALILAIAKKVRARFDRDGDDLAAKLAGVFGSGAKAIAESDVEALDTAIAMLEG